jgi:hypothetical protein
MYIFIGCPQETLERRLQQRLAVRPSRWGEGGEGSDCQG